MKKRLWTRLLAAVIALACLLPCAVAVRAEKDPIYDITLDSRGVYLMNLETGTVLYEKNGRNRMFPASLTKILTAVVVLDNCPDTGETITVTDVSLFRPIVEEGGMNMDIRRGETFTVQDLLLGMMMNSFCDAAELLAWHFGGESTENFIRMMNDKAVEIGMEDSHFANAHGLHDSDHWSTPHDLAVLLEKAVQDERFVELIRSRGGVIPATDIHAERKLTYTVNIFYPENKYYLDAFVGGKSGFTDQAGRCLATYSEKDGMSFVSVMLGANMDSSRTYDENMSWAETSTLLSYVYDNFSLHPLLEKGQKIADLPVIDSEITLPVVVGEDLTLLARVDAEPEYRVDLPEAISATEVEDGAVVGRVTLLFNDGEGEKGCPLLLQWDGAPIHTKSAVQKEAEKATEAVRRIFTEDKNFVILMILLLAVIILSIPAVKITQYARKKRARRPKH